VLGKAKEESRLFKVEEEARRYFQEQIELLRRIGFHEPDRNN
jgi:hypothetical protein